MLSFFRVLKFAFQDVIRNFSLAVMTVFILVLMLLSVNVLLSLDVITKQAVESVKKQVDVSFYFTQNATEAEVNNIKTYISSFPEIQNISVIDKKTVFESFKNRHKDEQETMDALTELGDNPFGPTMVVKTREPKDYQKIIQALDVPEYKKIIEARSFDQHEEAVIKLQNITNKIESIGFGLTTLFAIIAFLIIFNTIRVSINMQRVEIGIKRLVGASSWFIRGPYLIEALIFTICSVAITFAIMNFAFAWLDSYLAIIFSQGFSLTNYYKSNILLLVGIQSGAVFVLTIISSALAMRRQLKL